MRSAKFSLSLAEEKTALVTFNRWEPDDSGKFAKLWVEVWQIPPPVCVEEKQLMSRQQS
ncbi:MAG: hypothetical protein KDN22_30765 [Verrucomicrobiae bacterium]|nr:hypothetical protein [Verrucomicrobiae bacterium]